jgi:hypothetical protein
MTVTDVTTGAESEKSHSLTRACALLTRFQNNDTNSSASFMKCNINSRILIADIRATVDHVQTKKVCLRG